MAESRNTGAAADLLNAITPDLGERELHIVIWQDEFVKFKSSAAQLLAEGFEVDNWFIFIRVTGRTHHEMHRLGMERKSSELRDEYLLSTPAGRRKWDANFRRYLATRNDKDFQAFKALILGLIPPMRGRKAETATSGAAQ